MSDTPTAYDKDLYAWVQEQVALLREGAWQELDVVHLIEEMEDVGHSQRDALGSRLVVLLSHLLKLSLAARFAPQDLARAGRGWRNTVTAQRLGIAKVLRRNPSLRPQVPEELAEAYPIARLDADTALPLVEDVIPPACPWTVEQALDPDFWPEA